MNNQDQENINKRQKEINKPRIVKSVMNYSTITEIPASKVTKYNYGIDKYVNQN